MAVRKTKTPASSGTRRKAPSRTETTTIRIDTATHGALMDLAEELDISMGAAIARLLRHYRSKMRHQEAARALREMKKDPVAWAEFLGGEEEWPELERLRSRDKK